MHGRADTAPNGGRDTAEIIGAAVHLLERECVEDALRYLRSAWAELRPFAADANAVPALAGGVALTARELDILELLADGAMSPKDVARALGVTRNTVKTHLKSAYQKLGAHCRSEAIQTARQLGVLTSSPGEAHSTRIVPPDPGSQRAIRPT